jgi:hypothetical protein
MTNPTSLSLRPLSAMEHGIWRTDLAAPLNFTTTARITGPLTAEVLRAALPAVRARHVHLRARIAAEPSGQSAFRHDDVPPLELRVAPGSDWVQALDHEINQPFAPAGPLARFVLIQTGAGEAYVLVTLHHSIGDGMSGAFLMRDLIAACGQVLAGKTPQLAELPEAVSIDAGLPASARGLRAWAHHLRFVLRELWMILRTGRPLKVRRDRQLYAHSRRARVIPHQLEPAFAEQLSARARAEKTTVHGALSAAMLLGTLADANVKRAGVAFGSPVNLRPLLLPAVGEQLGLYVSMALYREQIATAMPFWDLARDVKRSLETTIARGDQLAIIDLLPRLIGLVAGPRTDSRVLLERFENAVPSTTGLTNLGRLTIETSHGPLKIEDCHFAPCPSALGDFLSTATSLNGRIFWNFVWADPVFTEAHASSLVAGIVERLKQSVA